MSTYILQKIKKSILPSICVYYPDTLRYHNKNTVLPSVYAYLRLICKKVRFRYELFFACKKCSVYAGLRHFASSLFLNCYHHATKIVVALLILGFPLRDFTSLLLSQSATNYYLYFYLSSNNIFS